MKVSVNKYLFSLGVFVLAWSPAVFAQQDVNGPGDTTITGVGVADGVEFTAQGVDLSTLLVGDGVDINTNLHPVGISTDLPNGGTVEFQGTTSISTIDGTVGAIGLTLLNINGGLGSSTLIFNDVVRTATFNVTGNGTMQFNADAHGALQFDTDGFLIVGGGTIFTGAVTNLAFNTGTVTLGSASLLTGAGGDPTNTLKQVNVLDGNATWDGAIHVQNVSLGTNTLFHTDTLQLGTSAAPAIINTTLLSDVTFGNISMLGFSDSILGGSVTVNVSDGSAILTSGQPLFIVSAGAGSNAVPVNVTGGTRYTYRGLNINGNIEIIPTSILLSSIASNPTAAAVGAVLNSLISIAAANPGSDLAFIENALFSLPNGAAFEEALLQISLTSNKLEYSGYLNLPHHFLGEVVKMEEGGF